ASSTTAPPSRPGRRWRWPMAAASSWKPASPTKRCASSCARATACASPTARSAATRRSWPIRTAAGPAPANRARTGTRPGTDPVATGHRYPVANLHGFRPMSLRPLLVAALLLLLPAAQAQVPRDAGAAQLAQADAHQAYMQRLAAALARDGGARDLTLAALLRRASAPPAQAPDDPSAPVPPPPDAQAEAWLRAAA